MDRIRYAVVAAGNIAQVAVLPAFAHAKKNSLLHAIVSSDESKRRELSEKYRLKLAVDYAEYDRVLNEVDAVYIALPNSLHREYAERAARAGVHVLCEKPMAVTAEDCRAMIETARANAVKLMIAYRLHFEPANLRAIELIRSGEIGEPRMFSSTFSHTVRETDIRQQEELAGGALYDMGVYCINAARYLFRAEPISAFAHLRVQGGVDQSVSAILRFPGDQTAQFSVSQEAAEVSAYRVVGEKGDIRMDPAYDYTGPRVLHWTVAGKTRTMKFKKSDQFAPELLHFSQCVLNDEEPEPAGEEGLADIRVVDALFESARSGQVVTLAPFERMRRPDESLLAVKPAVKEPETVHAPSPSA